MALGDSYAAGVGAGGGSGSCDRSTRGWAPTIATAYDLKLAYQACAGASTDTVARQQLGALGTGTSRVSLTIGGNDVGFAFVLFTCASPSWLSDCRGAIASGRTTLRSELPGRLNTLFTQIRQRAPRAKVTIVGYPHLFGDQDCNALTFFNAADRSALDGASDELDTTLAKAAAAHGFGFVDPRTRFSGHTPCDRVPWINGLSLDIGGSYHPNLPGQQAYAGLVGPVVGGTQRPAPSVTAAARPTDVRTVARELEAMDLASPENLKQAQAAGVSTARIAAYVKDLGSDDITTLTRGVVGLRTLDQQQLR